MSESSISVSVDASTIIDRGGLHLPPALPPVSSLSSLLSPSLLTCVEGSVAIGVVRRRDLASLRPTLSHENSSNRESLYPRTRTGFDIRRRISFAYDSLHKDAARAHELTPQLQRMLCLLAVANTVLPCSGSVVIRTDGGLRGSLNDLSISTRRSSRARSDCISIINGDGLGSYDNSSTHSVTRFSVTSIRATGKKAETI